MFQIPQPAVDEFCRAAGRAGGEIALFDQRDAQAAQRRVKRQAGAGYPPADDKDIENLFGESRKRFAPRAPGKFSRIHSPSFLRALENIILIARAFAVRRSLMLFFKSRFSHRGAETQRGRDGGTEGLGDGATGRLGDDATSGNFRPVAPSSRRPVSVSLCLCVSVSLWLALT